MTTLAIIGVSRGVGLATAKEALERGWRVRGLARNPAGGRLEGSEITLLSGDARDERRVAELIEGADAVVSALGADKGSGRVTLFSKSAKTLIAAMQSRGLRRLVAISAVGVGDSWGHNGVLNDWVVYPLLRGGVHADKNRAEKLIKASDLDWTIVRPPTLTNGRCTGKYEVITICDDYRAGKVSRADVAHFICESIAAGAHIHQLPEVIRPSR